MSGSGTEKGNTVIAPTAGAGTIRQRIGSWLSTCNCEKGYCTYCDLLFDVLNYIDEVEHGKCVAAAGEDPPFRDGSLEHPEEEAGTGEDSSEAGHEEGEGSAGTGGQG